MDINFIPFQFPGLAHVHCAFQTRIGGFSAGNYGGGNISFATQDDPKAVLSNRENVHHVLGLDAIAELNQIHTDNLVFEPAPVAIDATPQVDADGMACARPRLGLCIKTADCQPILIAHKQGRHIMAIHAGWRGNRCNFPHSAVQRFCQHYQLEPRDLLAVRGPSLGPAMAEFIHFDAEWGSNFRQWFNNKENCMDLWSLTRHQLEQAGLLPRNIFGLDLCTATMNSLFFSYRKEKNSGRQSSIIWFE
jgi:YfiH family protein